MTDIYISTRTQADYDALMRLAAAAGYEWYSKHNPTDLNCFVKEGKTVICLESDNRKISSWQWRELKDKTIETIPNLAGIKGIWHVTEENHPDFVTVYPKANHMLLIENGSVIQSDDGSFDYSDSSKHKALAVEYKPEED